MNCLRNKISREIDIIMSDLDELKKEIDRLKSVIQEARKTVKDGNLADSASALEVLGKIIPKSKRTLKGHLAKIYAMYWCADSRHLSSASQDGKLICWDSYSGNKIHAIPLRSSWVMTTTYAPTGSFVASGGA